MEEVMIYFIYIYIVCTMLNLLNVMISTCSRAYRLRAIPHLFDTTEELAAYRKANPSGKITLTPLYVEQILTMMIIGLHPRPKVI